MAIFAIMSTATYTVFNSYQQTKKSPIAMRTDSLICNVFAQFVVKSQQTVQRPSVMNASESRCLPGKRETLEFTCADGTCPFVSTFLQNQRVGYALEEGAELVRGSMVGANRAEDSKPICTPVLMNAKEVTLQVFHHGSGTTRSVDVENQPVDSKWCSKFNPVVRREAKVSDEACRRSG